MTMDEFTPGVYEAIVRSPVQLLKSAKKGTPFVRVPVSVMDAEGRPGEFAIEAYLPPDSEKGINMTKARLRQIDPNLGKTYKLRDLMARPDMWAGLTVQVRVYWDDFGRGAWKCEIDGGERAPLSETEVDQLDLLFASKTDGEGLGF